MKNISVLIKPASSLCNIRCDYCFYARVSSVRQIRSYGKMKQDLAKKMIENIFKDLEDGDILNLAFQGGEPTLAGLPYYKSIIEFVSLETKKVKVNFSFQTNGMLINDEWCSFFKEHNFLVGLSIDCHPHYHNVNRKDRHGVGTFEKVIQAKKYFDWYEIDYNILCVLTEGLAEEPNAVFQFLKEQQIDYVQFIPCLDDLNEGAGNDYCLTPDHFAFFYRQLLKLWMTELSEGHYISIRLFDDLVNFLVKKRISACGLLGNCQVQYVIEADGSVYPCDFYSLDEYRMGYIQDQTLKELFEQEITVNFLCESKKSSETCEICVFKEICRGGCKRMKDAMYVDENGQCGYQQLLVAFIANLEEIVRLLQRVVH